MTFTVECSTHSGSAARTSYLDDNSRTRSRISRSRLAPSHPTIPCCTLQRRRRSSFCQGGGRTPDDAEDAPVCSPCTRVARACTDGPSPRLPSACSWIWRGTSSCWPHSAVCNEAACTPSSTLCISTSHRPSYGRRRNRRGVSSAGRQHTSWTRPRSVPGNYRTAGFITSTTTAWRTSAVAVRPWLARAG